MAHELKPVMNNIIHKPITNLEALRSLDGPTATLQALKNETEPSLTKKSSVQVELSKEAKLKMKTENPNS